MTPEALAQLLAQLGIGAIFVWAWSQERTERQALQKRCEKLSQDFAERLERHYDKTPLMIHPPKMDNS